ncbi:MAG: acetate--CoA ligase family protein [Anaerolineaceae bacterium]|nr:acetate--CoA ligase family protein [Anaerolineaceae bacterium]
MSKQLSNFFSPRGVALIGASANPQKLSHGVLVNMQNYGYQGKVYPINPKNKEINGLQCYADVSLVPDPVDLAVIMLPAPYVKENLVACGKRGISVVTIISGGFKEVGDEGANLEKECVTIAEQYGMRLIGPNCVGTMDLHSGLNTTFIRGVPDKGSISFISQSGAVCGAIVDYVMNKGIGFSHFVSMGNEADVTETDLIEYFVEDPKVKVIAAYIEGIKDGKRFIEVVRKATKKKPVIILKAGRTDAGARAVSSHTGSLAGANTAYEAAFKQSGAIVADSTEELFDIALAISKQPFPKGLRTVMITNAGGPAALVSDSLSRNGLTIADLSETTISYMKERLNPSAQVENPVDMLGGASPQDYAMAIEACIKDPGVDIIMPINVPTSLVDPVEMANSIGVAAGKTDKTVIACMMGDASVKDARREFHKLNIPMYMFPVQTGKVLKAMIQYDQWLSTPTSDFPTFDHIDKTEVQQILKQSKTVNLGEAVVRPILKSYAIPIVPGDLATSREEAVRIAENFSSKVVMKIASEDILHKSDAGGIKLNLSGADEINEAFDSIMQNAYKYNPKARIDGVLIEEMLPAGQEVIIGMKRDPQFGPMIMFGMGGIFVELFSDVAFRVAPVTLSDVKDMISGTKAGKVLSGLRGKAAYDIDAVADTILRLSQIALDFPEIQELEINPLLVREKGSGVVALDARAILQ